MKKLMFALAAALPLFATADTNTVSRAEFDALKKEVKALIAVASTLHLFTDAEFVKAQNELRIALVKMKFDVMENEINRAREQLKTNEQMAGIVRAEKHMEFIKRKTELLVESSASLNSMTNEMNVAR